MSSNPRELSSLGPNHDVAWADDPDRIRAKQLEMLQIDIDHSLDWINTMQTLVDRELPDQEFTVARMAALHEWERSRKGAQKRLHYKYDPVKRKRHLAERDVERTLRTARETIAEHREKLRKLAAELDPQLGTTAGQLAPRKSVRPPLSSLGG